MTEVVTKAALQPILHANRQQAFGVSDQKETDLAISAEASRQTVALDAAKIGRTGDDSASLRQDQERHSNNGASGYQRPAASNQQAAAKPLIANVPAGPSKARVEIALVEARAIRTAEPRAAHNDAQPATPSVSTPQPAKAAEAPARAVEAPVAAKKEAAPVQEQVVSTGPLGPAAEVKGPELENISANIVGVAFAPVQVSQTGDEPAVTQRQKNFIFSQRRLFEETAAVQAASGKFVAEDTKTAIAQGTAPNGASGKFVLQPTESAAVPVAGKFAADADAAQKLFDKSASAVKGNVVDPSGETRLYDKIAQAEADSRTAQDNAQRHAEDQKNTSDEQGSQDSRQSLYQRAQAVAQALGDKSSNPQVKKLVAELELYSQLAGVGTEDLTQSTVEVTA